jgi:hypothetical protein
MVGIFCFAQQINIIGKGQKLIYYVQIQFVLKFLDLPNGVLQSLYEYADKGTRTNVVCFRIVSRVNALGYIRVQSLYEYEICPNLGILRSVLCSRVHAS